VQKPKWNLWRALMWGALLGQAYALLRLLVIDPGSVPAGPERTYFIIGALLAGTLGGAFVFLMVAAIRNLLAR
jgi:hypothetical protein